MEEVELNDTLELELDVEYKEDGVIMEDKDEDEDKELELDEVEEVELNDTLELKPDVEYEEDGVIMEDEDEEVEGLELNEVADEEIDELDEETTSQPPVIDGTASTPFPIATRFVPQFAELARWRF